MSTAASIPLTVPAPLGTYAHLLPPSWKAIITAWLAEDTPSFDYGGFVVGETLEEATLWGKSEVCPLPSSPARPAAHHTRCRASLPACLL